MPRRSIATLALSALLAVTSFGAAACGAERSESAGAGSEAGSSPTAAAAGLPSGVDKNDPAMVLEDTRPCTAPCWKQDVVYGSAASRWTPQAGPQELRLDLFRGSKTPETDAPVVVLLHGGGFVTGEKSLMRRVGEQLATAGFLVASIQYRLVPGDRSGGAGIAADNDLIPASQEAEEDAQRAMRWIRANAGTLGATKQRARYAVGGYSAGAIAALRVAVRGGDRATPKARRWRVGAAFAFSGTECGPWSKQFGCKAAYDRKDPPLLMFHGIDDSVVPAEWGKRTCAAAVLRGGGCKAYFYKGMDHFWDSGTLYGGADDLTKAEPAVVPTVARWLRKELAAS